MMGRTLADKIRDDVQTVHLRLDHFAQRFVYVSALEGPKPFAGIKTEHNSGPEQGQHTEKHTRRATFQIPESLTKGVLRPAKGDSIIDDTSGARVVWSLTWSNGMKLEHGLWSIDFTSKETTAQGIRSPATT